MALNQVEEFLLSTPIDSSNCVIVQDIKNNDVNKRLKRDLHEYTLMISCFCIVFPDHANWKAITLDLKQNYLI